MQPFFGRGRGVTPHTRAGLLAWLVCWFVGLFFPEIDGTRASVQVESLTGDRARTSVREPRELNRGAHVAQRTRASDGDVLHALVFRKQIFCVHSFQKKVKNVVTLQIPLKRAWSQTNHGNSTPRQKSLRKHSLPSQKKRDGQFLPNKLTAN